jgi:mannose-1-phosphate guanylyltransferase/mannose-6-phosphate isomerase
MAKVFPVILSGGAGSRLWPLSRESYPKQLLPLTGERTMLQDVALRVADRSRFESIIVVANTEHRFVIAEQLRQVGAKDPRLILEPVGRNTAPAVAVAALAAAQRDPQALILVMPADHVIPDPKAFRAAVAAAVPVAEQGALMLFGIQPEEPATAYGYIRAGEPLTGPVRRVEAFVEKPDLATAQAYVADGRYYWNSGIFLLPAAGVLAELERHAPAVLEAARAAFEGATADMDFCRLEPEAFERSPSIAIDVAVMEKTDRAAVAPVDFVWSDVGAWSALWRLEKRDDAGNVEIGETLAHRTTGSYLRSEGPLIATLGVDDLVVVATPDAVLVAHRDADQDVKQLVERLKASNHATATQTRRVHRPWGWYEVLQSGDRFQVKRITVHPGARLSLQKHFHRAEHWVVVSGTAEIELDGETRLLTEDQSTYVPLGAAHRLSNPGKAPLQVIEVQSGSYLNEDDIVRLDDIYARA